MKGYRKNPGDEEICRWCGVVFLATKAGGQKHCSPACSEEAKRERARVYAREVKAGLRVRTARVKETIREQYKCPYCGLIHSKPHDINPGKWQGCPKCMKKFSDLGFPADEIADGYSVGRVLGESPTTNNGMTGLFLDPPYSADRCGVYVEDSFTVAHDVREWAIANGGNKLLRIALCGYQGEHSMPEGWTCVQWKANGGYGNQGNGRGRKNKELEVIWFSPHCLSPGLFG